MDPEEALSLAEDMADLYQDAEEFFMESVADRLGVSPPEARDWVEAKLAEINALQSRIRRSVEVLNELTAEQLEEKIIESYKDGLRDAVLRLGTGGFPIRGRLPRINVSAVMALRDQTLGAIQNANLKILRSPLDSYRAIIAEASRFPVAGVTTRAQATQRALNRFADAGITSFVDKAGRQWSMDSYAEMATRTAITRANLEGRLQTLSSAGIKLFRISDSPEECPICRPWEGKVVTIERTKDYPTIDDARSAGLWHANCSHTVNAYTPGIEDLLEKPKANPRGYEERQRQRELERNLRRWKRRQAVAQTPDEKRKARLQVAAAETRLRQFARSTGRQRVSQREDIGAPGRRIFTSRLGTRAARTSPDTFSSRVQDAARSVLQPPDVPEFRSQKAFRTWMGKNAPGVNVGSLEEIPVERLNEIAQVLSDTTSRYPGLRMDFTALDYRETEGMPLTAAAAWTGYHKPRRDIKAGVVPLEVVSEQGAAIGIPPDWYASNKDGLLTVNTHYQRQPSPEEFIAFVEGDTDESRESMDLGVLPDSESKKQQAKGWWVGGSFPDLMRHEMGHGVQEEIQSTDPGFERKWEEFNRTHSPVSTYGSSEQHESFAEWYAVATNPEIQEYLKNNPNVYYPDLDQALQEFNALLATAPQEAAA